MFEPSNLKNSFTLSFSGFVTMSKHDLKASGTFFRKFACDLGFAGTVFIGLLPPEGDKTMKLTM